MDLVAGARRVVVIMEHTAKGGAAKILPECTLPLTGERCVHRIITERVVLDVTPEGLRVVELMPGWTREQVEGSTEARLLFRPAGVPMA